MWAMGKRAGRLALAAAAALVLVSAGAAAQVGPAPRGVGDPMPALALDDLGGARRDLAADAGKGPVLLFFWSVYCPNCKDAVPGLVDLYRRWEAKGLRVWAVNVDGDRFSNAVRAYVSDMELPFPVVYDRLEGESLVAADPLGVSKTPTLFLAGRDGRILLRQTIDIDYGTLAAALGGEGL